MAADRAAGVRRLNETDLHIADVERQITGQLLLVERLHADGQDALEAEHLLVAMRETLGTYHEHRRLILDEIGRTGDGSMYNIPGNDRLQECRAKWSTISSLEISLRWSVDLLLTLKVIASTREAQTETDPMNIQSHQDIAAAFDALLSAPQVKTPAPAFDAAAEFSALLASKPAGAAIRPRPAIAFRDATGAIVQPTVAQYMAGRIDIVAAA